MSIALLLIIHNLNSSVFHIFVSDTLKTEDFIKINADWNTRSVLEMINYFYSFSDTFY